MSRFPPADQRATVRGLATAVGVLLCAVTAAAAPANPVARLLACRAISADAARLHCFDRASAALARAASAGRPAASAAGTAVAVRPSPSANKAETSAKRPAALNPRQTFGLSASAIVAREVASGSRRKAISHITERVTRLRQAPDGRMVYWLANGQVWEQLVANGEAPPVKEGERLRISRGWLGSYWMQTASGRGCKVQRLH